MSNKIQIKDNEIKEEVYLYLINNFDFIFPETDNKVSIMANFSAVIKQSMKIVSWVGFYLVEEAKLTLGPFQGKIACSKIEFGKGVCGYSAQNKITVIVPNVDKFPGHIACDEKSKSEIVVPILYNNELLGVIDIDSDVYNAFDVEDQKYLEQLSGLLSKRFIK